MVAEREPVRPFPPGALSLVRLDPGSLQPLPGKGLDVGSGGCAPRTGGTQCWSIPPWSFSPDGALLAVARNDAYGSRSLRLVDVERLRATADIQLPAGAVGGLAWLARGRVLALQEECCSERQRLLAVDIARRRVVVRRSIGGSVLHVGRTARKLVVLVAPAGTIGRARLVVADSRGVLRSVRLERVRAGVELLPSAQRVEHRVPGLAVDPASGRAFVVDADLVAEVDLQSLAVSYHALARSTLAPAARAKLSSGLTRSAAWLGGGFLAVSGADEASPVSLRPAGLLLVDTRDWTVRTVDRGATGFLVAGDLLLATGSSWDSATGERAAIGLAAYGVDGGKRFQLFEDEIAWVVQVYANLAVVGITGPDGRQEPLQVVDLGAGRVVGARTGPLPWLPWLVVGAASGWWA